MLAQVFTDWCKDKDIELTYIQPGKPNQNAYIERFNRSIRDELLDPYLFTSLNQVREKSVAWMISYNDDDLMTRSDEYRRRNSGGRKPAKYLLSNCPIDGGAYAIADSLALGQA